MSNEEQMADLEESIMMNASNIGGAPLKRKNTYSGSEKTNAGLLNFGEIKNSMKPDLMSEVMELKQKNQVYQKKLEEQTELLKQMSIKLKKYKAAAKKE